MSAPRHRNDDRADGNVNVAPARRRVSELALRVASALVLAPIVLAITYAGGWLFLGLCVIAAGGILWEWTHLVAQRADPRVLAPGLTALLAAFVLVGINLPGWAVVALVLGAALVVAARPASVARPASEATAGDWTWKGGGILYAGSAILGPALLRRDPQYGFTALLLIIATVWTTDTLAFFCGRAVGGPRLWPKVSPGKTWTGAFGGLAGGVAAAIAVAYASGLGRLAQAVVMGLLLSGLAQAGDLFESAIKRRFGAKDTSRLIPGHGGLMDRLDGFLLASLAALLVGVLRQGTDAAARGFLLW